MPAWRVKAYVGDEIWARYYKFSFERNPWDRQVSWYHYKTKNKQRGPGFGAFNANKRKAWVENFDLYSIDDEISLDFVGQYENLSADFARAIEAIGLEGEVALPVTNVSTKRSDYRSYFDAVSRAQIAEWYSREIKAFGYKF